MEMNAIENLKLKHVAKQAKKAETVNYATNAFMQNVNEGKDERTAFVEAMKSVAERAMLDQDTFDKSVYQNECVGRAATAQNVEKLAAKITPEEVSKWLKVIKEAAPMIAGLILWIKSQLPQKPAPETQQPQQPQLPQDCQYANKIPESIKTLRCVG